MPERFEPRIRFMSEGNVAECQAEVIVREGEMVIDIPESKETEHYLVKGRRMNSYWAGHNEMAGTTGIRVEASWSELRDLYVGVWIEDAEEFLFSFPKPRRN